MTTVLVTGSTGTIGREVVRALQGRGLDVVVGLRDPSRGAPEGTRAVKFDWADLETHASAVEGIDRLFTLTPFVPNVAELAASVIAAAKKAGVSFVVDLSASGASEEAPMEGGRNHARIEKCIKESGISYTILQPTFFMDNVLTFQRDAILGQGAFYGASGGQAVSYISSADIGAVAATVLADPGAYAGRTLALTGGEAVTDAEVAALISKLSGREVRFVDLTLEQYREGLLQQGVPAWMVDGMVALESVKRNGWAVSVSPDVATVLGRAPETLPAFMERHAARLRK